MKEVYTMKYYVEPSVELLYVGSEDILTISDPAMDDLDWADL